MYRNLFKSLPLPIPFGPPHFANGGKVIALPHSDLNRLQPMPSLHTHKLYANGGEVEEEEEDIEFPFPELKEEEAGKKKKKKKKTVFDAVQAKKDLKKLEGMLESAYKELEKKPKSKSRMEKVKNILELIDHISAMLKKEEQRADVDRFHALDDVYHRLNKLRITLNKEVNQDEVRKAVAEGRNIRKLIDKIEDKLTEKEEREIESAAEKAVYREPEKKYSHITYQKKRGGMVANPLPASDVDRLIPMRKKGGLRV